MLLPFFLNLLLSWHHQVVPKICTTLWCVHLLLQYYIPLNVAPWLLVAVVGLLIITRCWTLLQFLVLHAKPYILIIKHMNWKSNCLLLFFFLDGWKDFPQSHLSLCFWQWLDHSCVLNQHRILAHRGERGFTKVGIWKMILCSIHSLYVRGVCWTGRARLKFVEAQRVYLSGLTCKHGSWSWATFSDASRSNWIQLLKCARYSHLLTGC